MIVINFCTSRVSFPSTPINVSLLMGQAIRGCGTAKYASYFCYLACMRCWIAIILLWGACKSPAPPPPQDPLWTSAPSTFEIVWDCLCLEELEGGWQNHPEDLGNTYNGKLYGTNLGITIYAIMEYNRRHGKDTLPTTAEYIRNITLSEAREIYRRIYWYVEWDTLHPSKACALFSLSIAMPTYYLIHKERLLGMSADEVIDEFASAWLPRLTTFKQGGINRIRKVRERCGSCRV